MYSGRMLNRFSKDFATIDGRLAFSLQAVNSSLAGFFASILTVTYAPRYLQYYLSDPLAALYSRHSYCRRRL
jgi:hypothetical protein